MSESSQSQTDPSEVGSSQVGSSEMATSGIGTTNRPGGRARVGVAAAAALALLGGGLAVADPLHWRDSAAKLGPAALVPADAESYAAVNLDPGISQQVEMVRFASKFSALRKNLSLSQGGDVKQELWTALVRRKPCTGVDYAADVKPWLGSQFAVATRAGSGDEVVVVQASDEARARAGMAKLATCWKWGGSGMAYRDGYLVVSGNQAQADGAVAAAESAPLGRRAEFTEDMGKVGTQGILSFWATRQGLQRAQQDHGGGAAATPSSPASPSTAAIAGQDYRSMGGTLRFGDGNPAVRVVAKSTQSLPTSTSHTTVDGLPADTAVVVGLSDGQDLVDQYWPVLSRQLEAQGTSVAELEKRYDVKLPDDLKTLFGTDLQASMGPWPGDSARARDLPVAVASRTDAAALQNLVDRLQLGGQGVRLTAAGKYTVASANPGWAGQVASPPKRLRDDQSFQAAYPHAEAAQGGIYVNLASFRQQIARAVPADVAENLRSVQAIGVQGHVEDADYQVVEARVTAG